MADHVPDKIKEVADHVEKTVDRQDERLKEFSEKVEPHLDEARARLAEAEKSGTHERH